MMSTAEHRLLIGISEERERQMLAILSLNRVIDYLNALRRRLRRAKVTVIDVGRDSSYEAAMIGKAIDILRDCLESIENEGTV
jgi:hypothetical protein